MRFCFRAAVSRTRQVQRSNTTHLSPPPMTLESPCSLIAVAAIKVPSRPIEAENNKNKTVRIVVAGKIIGVHCLMVVSVAVCR